jgi:hypothetical protein
MRFPQFKEELKHIRGVFEQYGKFKQGWFSGTEKQWIVLAH